MYSQIDRNKPNKTKSNTNFIITAKNPAGPWSEPHVIEGAGGIDPDLFFDDNGKVYFVGTHNPGDMYSNGIPMKRDSEILSLHQDTCLRKTGFIVLGMLIWLN